MVLEVTVSTLHVGSSVVLVLSVDLRQQHSATLWLTKQPSFGTALVAPHGDGPRKGGLNKACLTPTWLASRGKWASLLSSKKNERKKKKANLKVACWNIHTMQDSEDHPQQHSAPMARELPQLDIDIAALSKVRCAEQGSLREDGAGYTLF